ncbi:hypothetical protein N7448_010310 [Penicillium atrosanguineum]|nr:hypothetical protein N7448_010310 [Penicillium atrosanguineum]
MGSLGSFLLIYVLGGNYLRPSAPDSVLRPDDDEYSLKSGTDQLAEKFHRTHDTDVAAGYFAVCREYVPGGVNGKPPERTTPAGEVVAAESPSVYQSMYRSLFDRKQAPSIEPTKSNGKTTKRARNVFYIVLRHGHLMLYDDVNQVEVRYVISLAHHDVSVHGGEAEVPEAELWLKRNAICLSRRLDSLGDLGGPTPPFYLFSENLSDKEDFYFAMLQNQTKLWSSADRPPKQQDFNVKHIVSLVQRLHSSEEQLQTRWINAFFGRLFLALYQTPELEEFLRCKIVKKISRVNKPNFISKIGLHKIVMGEGAPFITNPRLKDLTVDGNCCVEMDLQYTGNFRLEISATVRIDLGPRFKAREVDIVLAVVLKKLEGHLLVRFKPPPSNRLWITFETMPRMVMDIQPIVSSKQITYSLILRTIESKIREVVAESIVLPFWDDAPFLDTMGQAFRGGIWQRDMPDLDADAEIPDESGEPPETPKSVRGDSIEALKSKDERTMSMPALSESNTKVKARKPLKQSTSDIQSKNSGATSTGIERSDSRPAPRSIRSHTFSNAADPVVTADNANKVASPTKKGDKSNATSAMIEISSRSPPTSPNRTPSSSPPTGGIMMPENAFHSRNSSIAESIDGIGLLGDQVITSPSSARLENTPSFQRPRSSRGSSTTSLSSEKSRRRSTIETFTKSFQSVTSDDKASGNMTIGSATAAAKKWGMSVFGKGEGPHDQDSSRTPAGTPDQPIGRGHPHPPPGASLLRPDKYALNRKSSTRAASALASQKADSPHLRTDRADEVLVVEAPLDSGPNSPAVGDVDSESGPREAILLESEASSNADLAETDATWDPEDSQDDRSMRSVDQTLASSPDSNEALPTPGQVEVSSA